MISIPRRGLLGIALFCSGLSASSYAAEPYTLDGKDLTFSRQQIAAKDPLFVQAQAALQKKADLALKHPLFSVMDKTLVAASGDKHDYYSFPPYWWPNPDTKDGLPYIRKDGQTNPDANSDATDKNRLVKMSNDVSTLALAWYFTQDNRYAQKAAAQLKSWFIDPQTRMNPNLQYAQAIPGINTGRGIGIIDSRALVEVVDAIALLQSSEALNENDVSALKQWFGEYYQWMTTSQNGFEEDNWHNNHGSYFDMQAATFALFSGKTDRRNSACTSPSCDELPGNSTLKAARWASWSARVRGTTAISTLKPITDWVVWARRRASISGTSPSTTIACAKAINTSPGLLTAIRHGPGKTLIRWTTRKRCAIWPPPRMPGRKIPCSAPKRNG